MVDAHLDAPFATLAYLVLDLHDRRCRYVVAGHPPPLVVDPSGSARYLEDGRTLPLGVEGDVPLEAAETTLETGATIVLYTDGLVERRDAPLDVGLELVRVTAGSVAGGPDTLVDHVLRGVFEGTERYDDVAILAARLEPVGADVLDLRLPADREGLRQMRSRLSVWLSDLGAEPDLRNDVLLAAWEACANAVEHAQGPASATFSLHADRNGQMLRLRVADTGRWRAAALGRRRPRPRPPAHAWPDGPRRHRARRGRDAGRPREASRRGRADRPGAAVRCFRRHPCGYGTIMTTDMSDISTTHEQPAVEAIRYSPDVAVLVIHGQADLHSAPELREQLHRVIDDGAFHVVVDLTDATFVDSMTLGVLLGGVKRLRPQGGQLRVVVTQPGLRRIFEVTLLDRVFMLFPTRAEALDRL